MAYVTTTGAAKMRKPILSRIFDGMIRIAERNDRSRQIAAYDAMSDEELARRGISRDMIATRVFADKMYI